MKRTFLLSIAVTLLMAFGCFDSHDSGDREKDRDDDAGDAGDDSTGARSDGESDDPDVERSIDIVDVFSQSREEAAEIATDVVCTYFEECMQQTISCVTDVTSSGGPGSPPSRTVDVRCEIVPLNMGYDECRESIGVTIERGMECAEITPEQAHDIEACFSAMRNAECVEITDERLREYEAAIARGEEWSLGNVPEACFGLEEIFECAEPSVSSAGDSERDAFACVPDQIANCTCPNGLKGTQTCLSDGTYSPCVCLNDIAPTSGVAGISGGAGAGGAVPFSPICVAGATRSCVCPDGSPGTQVCIDGSSYSVCECVFVNPSG